MKQLSPKPAIIRNQTLKDKVGFESFLLLAVVKEEKQRTMV